MNSGINRPTSIAMGARRTRPAALFAIVPNDVHAMASVCRAWVGEAERRLRARQPLGHGTGVATTLADSASHRVPRASTGSRSVTKRKRSA